MFSRRRGNSASRHNSLQRQPLDQSTTSNAALAATQAFLQTNPSRSNSLSSAAAAAALRSHTTSPEPVGSIQTKRMVRRGSITSTGGGSFVNIARGSFVDGSRPPLQRRGSSSSMTERTFRTPSPGRQPNGATSPDPYAPPVPALPKSIAAPHKRSSSVDPPARVMSPTQGGRAMSLDRNSMPPKANVRPTPRLSNVNEEMERTESNTSVNFSRPRSSQPSSPISPTAPGQYTHGTGNWFVEPHVAPIKPQQGVSATALEQKVARIQAAAGQSVKSDHSLGSAQGTHLSRSSQQTNAPQVEMETISVYDASSRTFVPKLRPKPRASEPASPPLPWLSTPAPGTYDPNTRTIVPVHEPKTLASSVALGAVGQQQRPTWETDVEPPPRNPARLSPEYSSFPERPLHVPTQSPSVRQGSEEEDGSTTGSDLVDTGRIISTSVGPARAYVAPEAQRHQRSDSLDVPYGAYDATVRSRGGSTSPSPQRSARFSATPVIPATIHNPPGRDMSPAKPALKHHSPSSSIRTSSPIAHFTSVPKSPMSEMSDTASQASQDAFSGKRKKSVRVSFDEQPQAISSATASTTPTAINSSVLDDDDDDELMKPRPALPSFGSVRSQRTPQVAEKVTEMAPERHESSSDHVIGGILRNSDRKAARSTPAPPEVTSKESAGDMSDESDEITSPLATSTPAKPLHTSVADLESGTENLEIRDFAPAPAHASTDTTGLPAINLLPPTPGVEDESRVLESESGSAPRTRSSFEIDLPGGWDKEEERPAQVASPHAAAAAAPQLEPDDEPIIYSSPASNSPLLAAIDEDSDNDDAEFSDAAEDLSEFDNGGYASLNAIAVSPLGQPPPTDQPTTAIATPPESPSVQQASKRMDRPTSDLSEGGGDWSQATAYWSQLSRQQREQIEREHLSSDDEARPTPAVRKTKKKSAGKSADPEAVPRSNPSLAAPDSAQVIKPAQPAPVSMKKSMRAQPVAAPVDNEPHMRQSMRSNSLRNGAPPKQQPVPEKRGGFAQKTMRPASSGGLSASAAGLATVRNRNSEKPIPEDFSSLRVQPKPKTTSAPVMTRRPQQEPPNGSDSESSFKKKRRSSATDAQGRYNMKRSMRSAPVQDVPPTREERPVSPTPGRGSGRDSFSIRSLSPTGSLFGRKKRAEDVRQSLRANSVDGGPRMTLRNGPPSKEAPKATKATQSGSRFKSRFADSDDSDDEPRPSRGAFRSRFADSDDEDENGTAAALTPVRGIPRRQGQNDGDSTDLEDEDEDNLQNGSRQRGKFATPLVPDSTDIDKAMEVARKRLGIPENPQPRPDSNQGTTLQRGSLRDSQPESKASVDGIETTPEKKKRGFMGSILRRNRASTASVPQVSSPLRTQHDAPPSLAVNTAAESSRVTARTQPQSPISQQGKLIRRSSAQQPPGPPRLTRGDSTYSSATAPPAAGEATVGGDWPLPDVPKIPEQYAERPNTSDGNPTKAGSVRFEDTPEAYGPRTGKKKKFGLLRRAFRLND